MLLDHRSHRTIDDEDVFCARETISPALERANARRLLRQFAQQGDAGGDDGTNPLGDLWVYDVAANRWEEPEQLKGEKPSPRSRHTLTLIRSRRIETQKEEDRLYLYGGVGRRTEEVMYLDLLRREWVTPRTVGDASGPKTHNKNCAQ